MILTCPQCSTRYHVDPASLGPDGRSVRCASCGNRWHAQPPADAPKAVDVDTDDTVPRPAPRKRPILGGEASRGASASLIGWLVGVLVVLFLASAVIGRNEIVAGFPASASLYQKLGLPVTMELGLQFENVTSERLAERGVSILVIEGQIVNVSEQERAVPPVKVTLLDDGGRKLQDELLRPEKEVVAGGGKVGFSGRLVNPARQARNFSVTFDVGS